MNWHTEEELGEGLEIKYNDENNPVVVALFDDGTMVTEPMAALQMSDLKWFAEGYKLLKENINLVTPMEKWGGSTLECPNCGNDIRTSQNAFCEECGSVFKLALIEEAEDIRDDE